MGHTYSHGKVLLTEQQLHEKRFKTAALEKRLDEVERCQGKLTKAELSLRQGISDIAHLEKRAESLIDIEHHYGKLVTAEGSLKNGLEELDAMQQRLRSLTDVERLVQAQRKLNSELGKVDGLELRLEGLRDVQMLDQAQRDLKMALSQVETLEIRLGMLGKETGRKKQVHCLLKSRIDTLVSRLGSVKSSRQLHLPVKSEALMNAEKQLEVERRRVEEMNQLLEVKERRINYLSADRDAMSKRHVEAQLAQDKRMSEMQEKLRKLEATAHGSPLSPAFADGTSTCSSPTTPNGVPLCSTNGRNHAFDVSNNASTNASRRVTGPTSSPSAPEVIRGGSSATRLPTSSPSPPELIRGGNSATRLPTSSPPEVTRGGNSATRLPTSSPSPPEVIIRGGSSATSRPTSTPSATIRPRLASPVARPSSSLPGRTYVSVGSVGFTVSFGIRVRPGEDAQTIRLEVHPNWAPRGAQRFRDLVESGFFTAARFHRVIEGFIAQVGIAANPRIYEKWSNDHILDDKVVQQNIRGTVSFGKRGPDSRSCQIFFNTGSNASRLDGQGFAPFAAVSGEGMQVVDRLVVPEGGGLDQAQVELFKNRGNAYLDESFPGLSQILWARIL